MFNFSQTITFDAFFLPRFLQEIKKYGQYGPPLNQSHLHGPGVLREVHGGEVQQVIDMWKKIMVYAHVVSWFIPNNWKIK